MNHYGYIGNMLSYSSLISIICIYIVELVLTPPEYV